MANLDNTWVKVYRKIEKSAIWEMKPFGKGQAWIDLLLIANIKDSKMVMRSGKVVTIRRGQYHTSYDYLAKRWGWSRGKVVRYFKLLNDMGMAHINGTIDGITVTIEKYSDFQDKRYANGTPNGTVDGTVNGTVGGTQCKNTKEYKEYKEESASLSVKDIEEEDEDDEEWEDPDEYLRIQNR